MKKPWIHSDSFIKRVAAVFGYWCIAYFTLAFGAAIIYAFGEALFS